MHGIKKKLLFYIHNIKLSKSNIL